MRLISYTRGNETECVSQSSGTAHVFRRLSCWRKHKTHGPLWEAVTCTRTCLEMSVLYIVLMHCACAQAEFLFDRARGAYATAGAFDMHEELKALEERIQRIRKVRGRIVVCWRIIFCMRSSLWCMIISFFLHLQICLRTTKLSGAHVQQT